jgi:hypothetical protein
MAVRFSPPVPFGVILAGLCTMGMAVGRLVLATVVVRLARVFVEYVPNLESSLGIPGDEVIILSVDRTAARPPLPVGRAPGVPSSVPYVLSTAPYGPPD